MQVTNIIEGIVWENIDSVIAKKAGCCKCDRCRADIAALALNNLKPRYTVSHVGSVISRSEFINQSAVANILVALTRAVEVVCANPRHHGGNE